MKQNTPRQKKNCLQNFDLSEHRQILSDLAIHIYHQFITIMEKSLTPAIGILQLIQFSSCMQHQITTNITLRQLYLLKCLYKLCKMCFCTSVITSTWDTGAREFTGDFQHEANGLQETLQ